jgi:hypothetical protein
MKHEEALELLPWFASDSLDADERDAVQLHVDECRKCASELVELRLVHSAVAQDGAEEPAYNPKIVSVVLQRIDALEADQQASPPKSKVTSLMSRLNARLQWSATPQSARFALAAQLVMVVGLAAVLLLRSPAVPIEYGTLSGPASTDTGARFSVVFRDDISVAQLNQTLAQLQLRIVGGPSALGVYTLATAASADRASVRQQLESSGLTTFVAPVPK